MTKYVVHLTLKAFSEYKKVKFKKYIQWYACFPSLYFLHPTTAFPKKKSFKKTPP